MDALVKNSEKIGIIFESLKSHVSAIYNIGVNFNNTARDYPKSMAAILKALKDDEQKLNKVLSSINFDALVVQGHQTSVVTILEALKGEAELQEKVLAKINFNDLIVTNAHEVLKGILNVVSDNEFLLRKCLFEHVGNNIFQSRLSIVMNQRASVGIEVVKAIFAISSKHEQLFFDIFNDDILHSVLLSGVSKDVLAHVKSSKFYPKFLERVICVIQSNWERGYFDNNQLRNSMQVILEGCKTASNDVQEKLFKRWDESKQSLASVLISSNTHEYIFIHYFLKDILLGNESLLKKVMSLKSSDKSMDFALLNSSDQFFCLFARAVKLHFLTEPQSEGADSFFMTAVKREMESKVQTMLNVVGTNSWDILKLYGQQDAAGKDVLSISFALVRADIFHALISHPARPLGVFLCAKGAAKMLYDKCSILASTGAKFAYENRARLAKAAVVTGVSAVCLYAAISKGSQVAMAA